MGVCRLNFIGHSPPDGMAVGYPKAEAAKPSTTTRMGNIANRKSIRYLRDQHVEGVSIRMDSFEVGQSPTCRRVEKRGGLMDGARLPFIAYV